MSGTSRLVLESPLSCALSRNLHYDSVVPKGKRSHPLGVQQWFFVLFSLPKLVRALLDQRALHPSHRTLSGSASR